MQVPGAARTHLKWSSLWELERLSSNYS